MAHAFESMRNDAELLVQTHHLIAEILPELRPTETQIVYFQCMEDGPESLLAPIEEEFARRGLGAMMSVARLSVFPHLCRMTEGPDRAEADDNATSPREPRQSVFLSATLERFGSAETTRHRVRDLSPQGMRIDQAVQKVRGFSPGMGRRRTCIRRET